MPTTNIPTAYTPVTNTIDGVLGWAKNQTRYVPYSRNTPCDEAQAVLPALLTQFAAATTNAARQVILTQIRDLTVDAIPVAPELPWSLRDCSAPVTPAVDVVTEWNEEAEPGGTTPANIDDLTNESGVTYSKLP